MSLNNRALLPGKFKYFAIIFCVGIYSLATVCAKFASLHPFLSKQVLFIYALEILCLAIYAVIWQQLLKVFTLSSAYAFRATSLIWVLMWSVLLFGDSLSVQKMIAVCLALTGMFLVNRNE